MGKNNLGLEPDESFFIEVKTTKRKTKPQDMCFDSVILTRNEWVAANKNKSHYAIYRVYITSEGNFIYKIFDPLNKEDIFCVPIDYRYEFSKIESLEKVN